MASSQGKPGGITSGLALALLAVTCVVCLLAYMAFALTYDTVFHLRPTTAEKLHPLSPEVIRDLCQRFGVQQYEPRCQLQGTVYSVDFYDDVARAIRGGMRFQEVDAKLGAYRYQCEQPVTDANGRTWFRCSYDFQGDHRYPFAIGFLGHSTTDAVVDQLYLSTSGS